MQKSKRVKLEKTTASSTSLLEKNVSAIRRIRAWKDRQVIHMPMLMESDLWEGVPGKEAHDA